VARFIVLALGLVWFLHPLLVHVLAQALASLVLELRLLESERGRQSVVR
jgi:hypothetical protein